MNKEKQLQFQMNHGFEKLLVTFCSDGPTRNRLHSILLNDTYPLDVIGIATEKQYADIKDQVWSAMANNSQSYWSEQVEAPTPACGCPFDEPINYAVV